MFLGFRFPALPLHLDANQRAHVKFAMFGTLCHGTAKFPLQIHVILCPSTVLEWKVVRFVSLHALKENGQLLLLSNKPSLDTVHLNSARMHIVIMIIVYVCAPSV